VVLLLFQQNKENFTLRIEILAEHIIQILLNIIVIIVIII